MKLGAYALEQDYSHYAANSSNVILAVVGTASKGPINVPTVCTSIRDFIGKFGPLDPKSFGLYAGQYFLNQSSKLYYVRVADGAAAKATAAIDALEDTAEYPEIEISDTTEGTPVTDALVLRAKVIGSDYNGMKAVISNATATRFDLTIKDSSDVELEKFTNLTMLSVKELNSKYFQYLSSPSDTATLKNAVYTAAGGDGEAAEGLEFESVTNGTFYNSLKIVISDSDIVNQTFTLSVLDKNGNVLSSQRGLSVAGLESFQNENFVFKSIADEETTPKNGVYEVSGGSDGSENIGSSTFINAAMTLASSNYDYTLLTIPGVSDPSLVHRVLEMLEARGDGLFLIDPPYGLTEQGVVDWHNGTGSYSHVKFNSSYGAVYYDWQKIYDSVNAQYVTVPPSVVVVATYAYSARISEIWYAPAGLTRGLVRGVHEPVSAPDINARNYLYLDNNVNCIVNDPQAGLCIFGQKTLLRANSSLNRVNVRQLMNYLKKVVIGACQYLTFEPNDRITWAMFEDLIEPTLEGIKNRRGVYEYSIVPSETMISPDDIDNYRMPGKILIKPTKTAEIIPVYFTLTATGVEFNEILETSSI